MVQSSVSGSQKVKHMLTTWATNASLRNSQSKMITYVHTSVSGKCIPSAEEWINKVVHPMQWNIIW
jgi:hypothetical protein